ncbi:type II secretion system F family protein [Hazenella sp. IB182357]|uniref:Type II secretion system F family protein n=1 Tax=Polycladospora coralii TaxID=2771432 RepID=A0A926NF77_9BACL|nr:type II secretion system F family protein [Polycladospora coralii]MBD1372429.1 type II secretion system F family protein [Polycladospora coralii]
MFFLFLMFTFLIWILLVSASIFYYQYSKQNDEIATYLNNKIPPWKVVKEKARKKDLLQHLMDQAAPYGSKIQILSDSAELEDSLIKASYPYNLSVQRLHGAKVLAMLGSLLFAGLYFVLGFPFAPIALILIPFVAYMSPMYLVRFLAKRRQEHIRYDLPDYLDMMSITLQAGMSLDDAVSYYVETTDGPLSEEFARLNQEIKFGVQRESAYRSLISRTTSSELEALIQSLIQAYNLGTPIADVFTQQAEEMRHMRAERAKEAAGKAAPKISLVSGLLIAPSIMLLILSSIIYNYFIKNNIFGG